MRNTLLLVCIFLATLLYGQDKQEIHQYFNFQDGIYLDHQSLMTNTPSISITSENKGVYNNPLKILRVNPIDFGLKSDQKIAYVVDQGLPYARVIRCCPDQVIYVGLTIVGRLSVLAYESEKMVDIPMTAYNPYNNKPFLKGSVKREQSVDVTQVIDFSSGEHFDITNESLSKLLNSNKSYDNLDSLIEAVSIFNKDNKIYISQ